MDYTHRYKYSAVMEHHILRVECARIQLGKTQSVQIICERRLICPWL